MLKRGTQGCLESHLHFTLTAACSQGSLFLELDVAYNMSIHIPLASHKVPLRWKGDWEIRLAMCLEEKWNSS